MAWPKRNQGDSVFTQKSLASSSNAPFEGNKRNSSLADDGPKGISTNVSFATHAPRKSAFKPNYVGGPVSAGASSTGHMHRGGRWGQGGFARVFARKPGSISLGAAGSGPQGSLSGVWGV
jgi:hypothetical protein